MSGANPPPPPVQSVGGGRAPLSGGQKAGIIAAGAVVLGALYWMGTGPSGTREAADVGGSPGLAGAMRQVMVPPPQAPEPAAATPVALPPNPIFAPPPPRRAAKAEKQKAAAIMAFEDRADGGQRADASAARRGEDAEDGGDDLAERLRATRVGAAKARRLPDLDLMITQGTLIPCVRKTPINTQLPGFVACETPVAVPSASGNVDLLPAKTKIVGQIQRAMAHGTDRAFILWTRAQTPDGVVIDLGSPGTDALGMNGVPVDVQTNFWARFGGAIMLSFVDVGLQAAALTASNAVQGGGNGQRLNFFQLQSGGRGAAARSLDATVNIPPFGTAPQGEAEAIFVAKDLDFRGVYSLRRIGR